MKTFIWILIATTLLLISTTATSAELSSGLIHAHSTFSDGQRTPEVLMADAVAKGCEFLIVTDHYEYIDQKQKIGDLVADDFGFANYQARFSDNPTLLGMNSRLVVLPCTELMFDGPHLLTIGDLTNFWGSLKKDSLSAQIKFNQENNLLSIAAHPSKEKYWVDRNEAQNISGIEFFNEGEEEYQKTRAWYLDLVGQGKNVWVIGGWDTHNPATDPFDGQRRTWLKSNEPFTRESLIKALADGRTYAANYGASIQAINFWPNYQAHKIVQGESFQLRAILTFPRPIMTAKKVRVYFYKGKSSRVFEWDFRQGQKELEIKTDDIPEGDSTYVIEIENCLITSPIEFTFVPRPAELSPNDFLAAVFNNMVFREYDSRPNNYRQSSQAPPRTTFKVPVTIQIALTFTNPNPVHAKLWHYLKYYLAVYGPGNKICYQTNGGSSSNNAAWEKEISYEYCQCDQPGRYRVELKTADQSRLITTAYFTVE